MGQTNSTQSNSGNRSVSKSGAIALTSCYKTASPDLSRVTNKPQPLKVSYNYNYSEHDAETTVSVRRIAVIAKPTVTPTPLTVITSSTSSMANSRNNSYCTIDDDSKHGGRVGNGSDSSAKTPAVLIQRQRYIGSDGFDDSESGCAIESAEILHSSSPPMGSSDSHRHSPIGGIITAVSAQSCIGNESTSILAPESELPGDWTEHPSSDCSPKSKSDSDLEGYHVGDPVVTSRVVPACEGGIGKEGEGAGDMNLLELESEAHVTPSIGSVIHTHTPFNSPRRLSSPLGPAAIAAAYTAAASSRITTPTVPQDDHLVLRCNKWKRPNATNQPADATYHNAPEDCMTPTDVTSAFEKWSARAETYACAEEEEEEQGVDRGLVLVDLEDDDGVTAGDDRTKTFVCPSVRSPMDQALSILIPSMRMEPYLFGSSERHLLPQSTSSPPQHRKRKGVLARMLSALRSGAVRMLTTCQLTGCQHVADVSTPISKPKPMPEPEPKSKPNANRESPRALSETYTF